MSYNAELTRKGPGLLVRDLQRFEDPTLKTTLARIAEIKPDVLALQSFDYDHGQVALGLVRYRLAELGLDLPYAFSLLPNTGVATGFDLNRDRKLDTASDRQGFGFFTGHGGVALLSRFPIIAESAQDFSGFLWKDLPGANLPNTSSGHYFTSEELDKLRLHNVTAWDVPIGLPDGIVHIFLTQTSPPIFDGPEDRNGLRNSDQIKFWRMYIGGWSPTGIGLGEEPFVLLGGLNNDPFDGEGLKSELDRLLALPQLRDPLPTRNGGKAVENNAHRGPSELDTVDWDNPPGNLRVDYVLPSARLGIAAAAVEWETPAGQISDVTPHKPVWVDVFWK